MAKSTGQKLAWPFYNADERRLRAGWRLALQLVMLFLLAVLFTLSLTAVESAATLGELSWLSAGVQMLAIVLSVWLGSRLLDRRAFADFGFHLTRRWWSQLVFGLLLGAGLMAGIFLIEWSLGWVTIVNIWHTDDPARPFYLAILEPLVLFLAVGIYEELWTRGYQLRNLAEGLRLGPISPQLAVGLSWLLTSLLFGLLHAGNPNATLVSTFNIALAGLFLGLGYVLTGELAIPIGIHISWNFFQGNVFGFPVSGNTGLGARVFEISQGGPPLWTGGPFGPEAGLLGIGALVLGSLLTWLYVRQTTGDAQIAGELAHYVPRTPRPAANKTQPATD